MKLVRLTTQQGLDDIRPCFIEVTAIRAITVSSYPAGQAAVRIHIGENDPITVRESLREVMQYLHRAGGFTIDPRELDALCQAAR